MRRVLTAATLGGVILFAASAFAQTPPASAPTFSKDIAPIFQAKCQACHQPNSIAPMSLDHFAEARPWARSIKQRVSTRQMPPWHIDQSVGVQKFKNDMSLTQKQIDTIVAWVDAGAPQGDPKDMPKPLAIANDNEWQAVKDGFGPPDLIIKSSEYKMPANHQDVWYRPQNDIPITEPRWVRMVEIRPSNLNARKTIHHSIAYLMLNDDPDAVNQGTGQRPGAAASRDDLVARRPQLMEWAIGKGYDRFRDGTGKLIVPGEKISWDQHIHAVGEEVSSGSEIGLWLYPKGQSRRSAAT
jgi:mono/diheme cytochrome c family protein